jgi:UDPglucose 6-dehydrogenase
MKISVVGLGKLGLCTASYFASKGHKVIGVEKSQDIVNELRRKSCTIKETGLEKLLSKAWGNLQFTQDITEGVLNSDASLIIVPTPSKSNGKFSNEYVKDVLKDVGEALKSKEDFHVVDIVSTVMPGSCEKIFIPMLEDISGKTCGKDFGVVYNPEFIALGSVIRDFSKPDMVLIGASDKVSAERIEELYLSSCENKPRISIMSLINAEITKLTLNCFVTTKISFANELSNICHLMPGADVDEITDAIGFDTRIGGKYLRAGLGFGGTCFPRDNIAFQAFCRDVDYEAKLSGATVTVNNSVVEGLFNIITENVPDQGRIGLLGLSYKPDTHIIEESQSIILAKKLIASGYNLKVYDPKAMNGARAVLINNTKFCDSPSECAQNTDAVVLLTCWPEFEELEWDRISEAVNNGTLLLDCWRQLKSRDVKNFNYVGLGIGTSKICHQVS